MALTFEQHLELAAKFGRLLVDDAPDVLKLASDVPALVRLVGKATALIDSIEQVPPLKAVKQGLPGVTLAPEIAAKMVEINGLSPAEQAAFDRASGVTDGT